MTCCRRVLLIGGRIFFDKKTPGGVRRFGVSAGDRMRFVQFTAKNGGPQHIGAQIQQDGDVFDISGVDSSIPNSLVKFLATGSGILEKAKRSARLSVLSDVPYPR